MTPDNQDPGPEDAGQDPAGARAARRRPAPAAGTPLPEAPREAGQTAASAAKRAGSAARSVRSRRAGIEEYQAPGRIPRRRTGRAPSPRMSFRVVREVRPPTEPAPAAPPVAAAGAGRAAQPARHAPEPRPAQVQVFEDHDLPVVVRRRVWEDLVDWVIWVHDAYELSLEEALPPCWPQHPGLVRELAALRAWRAEIYQPYPKPPTDPDAPAPTPLANGGAARAWHSELRNVLAAVKKMYAPRCRAGHRDAPTPWTGDASQRAAWLAAQGPVPAVRRHTLPWPAGARPRATGTVGAPDGRLVMSDADMQAARTAGLATGAGAHTDAYLHHQDTWWARHPDGNWAAVTDAVFAERLNRHAAASARAETAVADAHPPTTR